MTTPPSNVPQWNEPAQQPTWNQSPPPQQGFPPAQPPKKQGNPVVGLIALVLIGVGVWYFFFRGGSSPNAPVTGTERPAAATVAPAEFTDISLSGTGDSVKSFSIPTNTAAIAKLTHSGSSNFAVTTLASDGSTNDLIVNTIGRYSGTVIFDTSSLEHSTALEITADGPWTVTIQHPSKARIWNPASHLTGSGDDVVRLVPAPTGLTPITFNHTGESNFAVLAYGSISDLLVNEIGPYRGTTPLPAGTQIVSIEADGSWTATP